jgi:hypothetical protein
VVGVRHDAVRATHKSPHTGLQVIEANREMTRVAACREAPECCFYADFMTADMKLLTRASRVPQLFIQDTGVRCRSCR